MPFSPADAEKLLKEGYAEGPDRWMAAVNTVLLDIIIEHTKTRDVIAKKLYPKIKKHGEIFDVLQAQFAGTPDEAPAQEAPTGEAASPPGGELAGEDQPNPAQTAAEDMMNQAAGPRDGEAPAPAPVTGPVPIAQRLKVPPKGGARSGAPIPAAAPINIKGDGSDAEQAQIEAMMNASAGPRQ